MRTRLAGCGASCSTRVAAAEHAKLSLPGNRVGLKTTGFCVYIGIGSSVKPGTDADPNVDADIPAERNFAFTHQPDGERNGFVSRQNFAIHDFGQRSRARRKRILCVAQSS